MLNLAIIGNIGSDPEIRYAANGNAFMRFSVASNFRKYEGDGTYSDATYWVRVTVTGRRVESLQEYLKKGMRVYVDGRLEARPWTDQQGQLQPGLEVFAAEVQFMSPREESNGSDRPPAARPQPQAATAPPRGAAQRTPQERAARQQAILGDYDDVVPF